MVSINNLALKTAVNSKHYVILGAGFTGLCAAHFIKKKHPYCRITIIEASDRVGGWVNSYISPSGAVHELGPRSIRYTYNGRLILNLISDLGLQDRIATPSGGAYNRYLYVNNKLQKLVMRPWQKEPFSQAMIHFLLNDLKQSSLNFNRQSSSIPDETIYDFACRHFGSEMAEVAFSAIVRGVYSGDIKKLSLKSCFPDFVRALELNSSFVFGMIKLQRLMKKNREFVIDSDLGDSFEKRKIRTFTFKHGLRELPESILKNMQKDELFQSRLRCKATKIWFDSDQKFNIQLSDGSKVQLDELISTLPSQEIVKLFSNSGSFAFSGANPEEVSKLLEDTTSVPYADVAVVNFEFPREQTKHIPDAFGYLVPAIQKANVIGVTFDSSTFPDVYNGNNYACRFTAMINECKPQYSDSHYIDKALEDLRTHLSLNCKPDFASTSVSWKCIPQYEVNHSVDIVHKFRKFFPKVHFLGTLFHTPSLVDCCASAFRLAKEI